MHRLSQFVTIDLPCSTTSKHLIEALFFIAQLDGNMSSCPKVMPIVCNIYKYLLRAAFVGLPVSVIQKEIIDHNVQQAIQPNTEMSFI